MSRRLGSRIRHSFSAANNVAGPKGRLQNHCLTSSKKIVVLNPRLLSASTQALTDKAKRYFQDNLLGVKFLVETSTRIILIMDELLLWETDLNLPLKGDGSRHGLEILHRQSSCFLPSMNFSGDTLLFPIFPVSYYLLDPPKCQTCVSLTCADDEESLDDMSVSAATGFSKGSSTSASWIVHCVA